MKLRHWVACLTLLAAGCATTGGGGSVAELHLFAMPSALNLDGLPGPDSLGVTVYASSNDSARGIPLQNGTLEVLMFDGVLSGGQVRATEPRKVWPWPAGALKALESETSLGTGYQLALRWGAEAPRAKTVTVAARYRPAKGPEIWSAPNTVAIGLK